MRAVTATNNESLPSEEITAETKVGAAVRRLATAGAFIAATLTAPIAAPVEAYIRTGKVVHEIVTEVNKDLNEDEELEEDDKKMLKGAVYTAGAVAATGVVVGTPLLVAAGTIAPPLVGGSIAMAVHDKLKPDEF